MKYAKMNFATRTLTISKDFADLALAPNSEEANYMQHCRSLCPDLKIAYRTHAKSKSTNPYKGMSYKKMENYIRLYENADELLKEFCIVKAVSQIQKNKFQFVYNWFMAQFPHYDELPEIRNGKLYTQIVAVPEVEEAKENLLAAAA